MLQSHHTRKKREMLERKGRRRQHEKCLERAVHEKKRAFSSSETLRESRKEQWKLHGKAKQNSSNMQMDVQKKAQHQILIKKNLTEVAAGSLVFSVFFLVWFYVYFKLHFWNVCAFYYI